MMGRPHLSDSFGQIQPDRKLSATVSDDLHAAAQRLANLEGLSDSAWLRGLAEREVMKNIVRLSGATKKSAMYALVHKVPRKT